MLELILKNYLLKHIYIRLNRLGRTLTLNFFIHVLKLKHFFMAVMKLLLVDLMLLISTGRSFHDLIHFHLRKNECNDSFKFWSMKIISFACVGVMYVRFLRKH